MQRRVHCDPNFNGSSLNVREEIRVRNDRCVDAGTISMTFADGDPDTIHWRYTGGGIEAYAELHRSQY